MATDIIKRIVAWLVAATFICTGFYYIGLKDGQKSVIILPNQKVDTLYVRDTITQYKPILEERVVLQKVPVPVVDTLRIHDTLYVYLEREQVVWEDSLSRIYASGIMPEVDSVKHFLKERIVMHTETQIVKERKRWGFGIQAGYGVQFGERVTTAPYIGVGISYDLLRW